MLSRRTVTTTSEAEDRRSQCDPPPWRGDKPQGACRGRRAAAPRGLRPDPCPGGRDFRFRPRIGSPALPTTRRLPVPTARKAAQVAEIKDRMARASIAISADYRGLSVAQITELRRALRPSGAEVKVVKNTLALMAAKAAGRENMADIVQGPTALTIGFDDPIAPVKAFTEHLRAKRLNIEVHGGWLEGKVLTRAEV